MKAYATLVRHSQQLISFSEVRSRTRNITLNEGVSWHTNGHRMSFSKLHIDRHCGIFVGCSAFRKGQFRVPLFLFLYLRLSLLQTSQEQRPYLALRLRSLPEPIAGWWFFPSADSFQGYFSHLLEAGYCRRRSGGSERKYRQRAALSSQSFMCARG